MQKTPDYSCNPLVEALGKPAALFTKADIERYVIENGIRHVNFMYPGGDGRLKTLNFVVNDAAYLDEILTCGERVDGSSLFSYVEASSSDLYVVPRFSTAFMDPFAELPTLCLLCSFFDKDGEPLASSPEYTLRKACAVFREETGLEFEAMGELEYYVIAGDTGAFPAADQRGYHESGPFAKYEQNEIEFLPCPAESAADQLTLAKWVIRNLGARCGLDVTFAPKITVGKAGSGLHIHMRLTKGGRNQMLDKGAISKTARRAIAGLMELAPSITAFGNVNPTSYLRLVPHQEAPTNVCWGDRNRSVLVRVPLGWAGRTDMCAQANPLERAAAQGTQEKQTVEIRSPDASANVYLLLAGLAVALRHGLEKKAEDALALAAKTYVNVNIHKAENAKLLKSLATLPDSCWASADRLLAQRKVYEAKGVFSPATIDGIARMLKGFDDRTLRARVTKSQSAMADLVKTYFHCG